MLCYTVSVSLGSLTAVRSPHRDWFATGYENNKQTKLTMEPLATEKKRAATCIRGSEELRDYWFLEYYMLDSAIHPWYIPARSQFL